MAGGRKMIKEIVKDTIFLSQKAKIATKEDVYIIDDLKDTLKANQERCVGMAANMIGYNKSIIIVLENNNYLIMVNPVIIKTSKEKYIASEGCLSHTGQKETERYESIKVEYLDEQFKKESKPLMVIRQRLYNMKLII